MKQWKTSKSGAVLAALALCAWCACAFAAQRAGDFASGVAVRWGAEEGVSPAQVEQARRYAQEDGGENLPQATLWQEYPDATLTREDASAASASVTRVTGAVERLYPLGFLSGGWPLPGDGEGCAVDEATAWALWGGTSAVGKTLIWEGGTYTVRGVLRGARGLVVVRGEANSAAQIPNLLLFFPQGGGRQAALDYLNRSALPVGGLLDLELLSWSLGALSALPGLLLAVGILRRLLHRGWQLRAAPLLLVQYLVPALLGGGAVLWAVGLPLALPDRIIPTQWSDFEFWSRLAGQLRETGSDLLSRPPTQWDAMLWCPALLCVALLPFACALTAFAAERVHAQDDPALAAEGLAFLGGLFALAWLCAPLGGLACSRGMWMLPLLWLAADRGLAAQWNFILSAQEGGTGNEEQARDRAQEEGLGRTAQPPPRD